MKKSIISLVLILAVVLLPMQFAFADDATYTAVYNEVTDGILVSGTVQAQRANIPLTLTVTKADGTFVGGYQTTAVRNQEGKIAFAFDEVKLPLDAATGDYLFTVTGDGVTPASVPAYSYYSTNDSLAFINDINAKIAAGGAGIYEKILSGAAQLTLSNAELTALDANAQLVFNNQMLAETYTVPASITTEADANVVKEAFKKLVGNAKKALTVASFANISNAATLNAWFNTYYDANGFNLNDPSTSINEASISAYVANVKSTASFVSRIAGYNNPDSLAAIKAFIYESGLLTTIETAHFSNTYGILTAYPTLFAVNTTNLARLSSEKQADIYEAVANAYYATYSDLVTVFDNKVLDAINAGDTSTTVPGGWGGGSGGGSTGGGVFISGDTGVDNTPVDKPQFDEKPVIKEVFSDLASVSWAKDAILALEAKGIINGKADGVFAPNDLITRAEFIKLLVAATNAELADGEISSFTDVSADAWYCPYIAAAEKSELILGNDDNKFMPSENITRQDMAVILSRAFKLAASEEKSDFADADDISDYAKEAVNILASNGIIKGMGEGLFAPLSNATRAQAAVMLYNILK